MKHEYMTGNTGWDGMDGSLSLSLYRRRIHGWDGGGFKSDFPYRALISTSEF